MDKGARRVGIICHSMNENEYYAYEVKLYLINVDAESSATLQTYTRVVPAVRFRFLESQTILAVCLVNSTLYMFGGPQYSSSVPEIFRQKYAVKFVLTDEVLAKGDYTVCPHKDLTQKISVMNHDKDNPVALPTPDGNKILLFGTRIGVGRSCRDRGWYDDDVTVLDTWEESCLAFEMYDVLLDTWEQLPGLPCKDEGGFSVRCYSFVDDCRFFVVTDKGQFVLDFKDKVWESVVDALDVYDTSGYFVTAKGRYVLTSAGMAYDFGSNGGILSIGKDFNSGPLFPLSSFSPPNAPASLQKVAIPSIVHLGPIVRGIGEDGEEDGEVCNTCVLRLEMRGAVRETRWGPRRGSARLLIDVCRTELTTLNTTVSNCVSLHIDYLVFLKALTLISV